jgi:hypothetical protein
MILSTLTASESTGELVVLGIGGPEGGPSGAAVGASGKLVLVGRCYARHVRVPASGGEWFEKKKKYMTINNIKSMDIVASGKSHFFFELFG